MTFAKRARIFKVIAVVLLLAARTVYSVEIGAPNRPKSVPADAVWVGGPDGGVWIVLKRSDRDPPGRYQAKIYYPSGDREYQGPLVLKPASPEPPAIDPAELEGWDGDEVLLSNGRSLKIP